MCELEWDGVSTDVFKLNKLNTVENDYPKNRFNDGKCDPQGRLWAGMFYDGNLNFSFLIELDSRRFLLKRKLN